MRRALIVALALLAAPMLTAVVVEPADAKGPGVEASWKAAVRSAGAKCRSRQVFIDFGIPLVVCEDHGASFCHIPRYNTQQVFCMAFFWLDHRYNNARHRYEFCTRPMWFRRNLRGQAKVTKPYYGWECDFPGWGPPSLDLFRVSRARREHRSHRASRRRREHRRPRASRREREHRRDGASRIL